MEQMFADPEIDAVLLVLPIPVMSAAIEAALRAGKHVLSEKPMAPSMETAMHLLGVQRELGPTAPAWIVLENWSLAKPSVRWLRERLQEGAIGTVLSAHCSYDHPADGAACAWRSSPLARWWLDGRRGRALGALARVLLGEPSLCSANHTVHECAPQARGGQPSPPAATAAGPAAGSLHLWSRFEHCTSAVTISLSYGVISARKPAAQASNPLPALRIVGERGTLSWWPSAGPSASGGARVQLERAGTGEALSYTLDDDWVEGGVRANLESAVQHIRRRMSLDSPCATPRPLPSSWHDGRGSVGSGRGASGPRLCAVVGAVRRGGDGGEAYRGPRSQRAWLGPDAGRTFVGRERYMALHPAQPHPVRDDGGGRGVDASGRIGQDRRRARWLAAQLESACRRRRWAQPRDRADGSDPVGGRRPKDGLCRARLLSA